VILGAVNLFERAAVIGAVAVLWLAAVYGTDRILHWILYFKYVRAYRHKQRGDTPGVAERRAD
jgi:hypothetical protein